MAQNVPQQHCILSENNFFDKPKYKDLKDEHTDIWTLHVHRAQGFVLILFFQLIAPLSTFRLFLTLDAVRE